VLALSFELREKSYATGATPLLLRLHTQPPLCLFVCVAGMLTNSAETLADIITGINLTTTCTASLWVLGVIYLRVRANKRTAALQTKENAPPTTA